MKKVIYPLPIFEQHSVDKKSALVKLTLTGAEYFIEGYVIAEESRKSKLV